MLSKPESSERAVYRFTEEQHSPEKVLFQISDRRLGRSTFENPMYRIKLVLKIVKSDTPAEAPKLKSKGNHFCPRVNCHYQIFKNVHLFGERVGTKTKAK